MDNVFNLDERTVRFSGGLANNNSILGIFSGLNFNSKWRNLFTSGNSYYSYARDSQSTPHTINFPVGTRYIKICFFYINPGTNSITIDGIIYTFDRTGAVLTFKAITSTLDTYITNDIVNIGIRYITYR